MSEGMFDRLLVVVLLVYSMIMYSASWFTGKPLDITSLTIILSPILTHSLNVICRMSSSGKEDNKNVTTVV